MAKFLNTSATNYFLEELIKAARDRLVLISPYLKLADRVKELLEDKNRLKIDIRIVYGKNELQPEEITWLRDLAFVRTSFCKNLHAKCYLNEESCIITSLNLYEFSQINNNEMGVYLSRAEDPELYRDAYDEAQRIIRVSDEIRMTLEKVSKPDESTTPVASALEERSEEAASGTNEKMTTSRLAKRLGMRTRDLMDRLIADGYLEQRDGKEFITAKGKQAGGEFRLSPKYGPYFLWPETIQP